MTALDKGYELAINKRGIWYKLKAINRSKKVSRSKAGTFSLIFLLMIFAIFMALPMAYMISNAFKPQDELLVFPPHLFPTNPTFKISGICLM